MKTISEQEYTSPDFRFCVQLLLRQIDLKSTHILDQIESRFPATSEGIHICKLALFINKTMWEILQVFLHIVRLSTEDPCCHRENGVAFLCQFLINKNDFDKLNEDSRSV